MKKMNYTCFKTEQVMVMCSIKALNSYSYDVQTVILINLRVLFNSQVS